MLMSSTSPANGRYPSFQMCRVVRDGRSNKSRGYGFVSFRDPWDMTKALREMHGAYVGNRPIKVHHLPPSPSTSLDLPPSLYVHT